MPADPGELAEEILRFARAAGLDVGDRLPTERQLAEEHGVTRTSVRRALAQLEAEGLLMRQVGRGTFLRDRDGEPGAGTMDAPQPADIGPADVMAVRRLIEPSAMALVVTHTTARDLTEMDRCLARGDRASNYAEFEVWDIALHHRLIQATRNPLLIRLYATVEVARQGPLWGELKRRNDSIERRNVYQCEHHDIVDAVRARDSDAAVEAMRAHLTTVSNVLFGTPL
jgi:DNA-binding FadR family transcriptional regulator